MKSTALVEMTSRLSSMAVPTLSPMNDKELVIASRLFWMPNAALFSPCQQRARQACQATGSHRKDM